MLSDLFSLLSSSPDRRMWVPCESFFEFSSVCTSSCVSCLSSSLSPELSACLFLSLSVLLLGTLVQWFRLFASQKPGCLLLFQTQPSSLRASPCTARIEQRSSQGKAEVEVFVSILTTCGVMKGTYTLLNPSAPLIWNFICFCVDHSGYRENFQPS